MQWRIKDFGGGGQNIVEIVGVFAWREARGEAMRLLGGFGGMLPREFFKKLCVLENIQLELCKKRKSIHFL